MKTIKIIAIAVLGFLAFTAATLAFATSLKADINRQLAADKPSEGIGRVYAEDVPRYAGGTQASEGTALRVFCETDEDLPAWFNPSEPMSVEWTDNTRTTHSDALDYNLQSTLWGWDGHGAEVWELDLFAMIFYKEFWGTSIPCCEAGCDAMLNLWASGLYGRTMGEVLSAVNDSGYYIFSTYPSVWQTVYDPDGLAWCKEFCRERFLNGPTWTDAMYFQLYGYHDTSWSIPLYEIDGVYFSAPRG